MASGSTARPSGGDGGRKAPAPSSGKGRSPFFWSSSSPSAAEVLDMERRFPEVIQLPQSAIAQEVEDWTASGLIASTLSRWVPSEAVIREFRRAGLAGRIEVIQLAHRTFLLKFELAASRSSALLQPWVVNGQPLALEPWRPDFIPGDGAVTSVLLWIRLPSLPIEYWTEESLRSILNVAGSFGEADVFTKQRRRGGYARASVRVDLSRALRPGARIRASGAPFWQSFVYEHVDCICSKCASIHQSGFCSAPSSSSPEADTPATAPPFGPWMAAIRQRKAVNGRTNSATPRSKATAGHSEASSPVAHGADEGEWLIPGKSSRRKALPPPSQSNAIVISSDQCGKLRSEGNLQLIHSNLAPCREKSSVPVTVHSNSVNQKTPGSSIVSSKGRRRGNPMMPSIDSQGIIQPLIQIEAIPVDPQALFHIELQTNAEAKSGDSLVAASEGIEANQIKFVGVADGVISSKSRAKSKTASLKRARVSEAGGSRSTSKALKGKCSGIPMITGPSVPGGQPLDSVPPQAKQLEARPCYVNREEVPSGRGLTVDDPMESVQLSSPVVQAEPLAPDQRVQEHSAASATDADMLVSGAQEVA